MKLHYYYSDVSLWQMYYRIITCQSLKCDQKIKIPVRKKNKYPGISRTNTKDGWRDVSVVTNNIGVHNCALWWVPSPYKSKCSGRTQCKWKRPEKEGQTGELKSFLIPRGLLSLSCSGFLFQPNGTASSVIKIYELGNIRHLLSGVGRGSRWREDGEGEDDTTRRRRE